MAGNPRKRKYLEPVGGYEVLHDHKNQNMFLEVLALTGSPKIAAETIGIKRGNARQFRKESPGFRGRWDEAMEEHADMLEKTAVDRAVEGILEPVYFQGEVVGHVRKYSDSNLQFVLKGRRSKVFRDRSEVKVTGLEKLGERMTRANNRIKDVATEKLEDDFNVIDPNEEEDD